jgi:hypothetical protein
VPPRPASELYQKAHTEPDREQTGDEEPLCHLKLAGKIEETAEVVVLGGWQQRPEQEGELLDAPVIQCDVRVSEEMAGVANSERNPDFGMIAIVFLRNFEYCLRKK